MTYLIISDIHGSNQYLWKVLNTPHRFDAIILVGDLMYHGPRNPILNDYNPSEVAKQLNAIKVPILAVRGNCDSEVDQMLLNFPIMQDYSIFAHNHKMVMLTHGHIIDPKDELDTHVDIFISGHTHLPGFHRRHNTLFVNPGSISLPKGSHPNTYAIMDDDTVIIYTLDHKEYLFYDLTK